MKKVAALILFILYTSMCYADVYTVNTTYSSPYSTEGYSGILDLTLKEMFKRAGHTAVIQKVPAERSLNDVNSGFADADVGRVRGLEKIYKNFIIVDEPIIESRDFVAFTLEGSVDIDGYGDLKGMNVGSVRGWKIFEMQKDKYKSFTRTIDTADLFNLLKKKRIDVALNARLDGLVAAYGMGIEKIVVHEPPLASMEMFVYLNNKHSELAPVLAEKLREMKKDGTLLMLYQKVLRREAPAFAPRIEGGVIKGEDYQD
ncbi:substrate-binding periplasmic protein [Limisalsivibrio acetivorans]|uniref:substrate-binding periplasmic protein n=1 Tax=Limisalsivibrio acetivorans TaxID=1304888 RepID=UPI0003B78431|nr:transporter substrate-binding domain-containing protein [Limisalsivibrio acetivorans]